MQEQGTVGPKLRVCACCSVFVQVCACAGCVSMYVSRYMPLCTYVHVCVHDVFSLCVHVRHSTCASDCDIMESLKVWFAARMGLQHTARRSQALRTYGGGAGARGRPSPSWLAVHASAGAAGPLPKTVPWHPRMDSCVQCAYVYAEVCFCEVLSRISLLATHKETASLLPEIL
jgi:hypothetical protein